MTSMVERVARAIASVPTPSWRFNKERRDGLPYEVFLSYDDRPIDDDNPEIVRAYATHAQADDAALVMFDGMRARVAIAAMREPTEAMCRAATRNKIIAAAIWRAMIDKVLAEGPQ